MSKIILKGRTLSFLRQPKNVNDSSSYEYNESGAILINNGIIEKVESYEKIKKTISKNIKIFDHSGKLLMPGFIDPHLHYPQTKIIGSYASNLLEWLKKYTFLEEKKYSNKEYSIKASKIFFNELINNGTTSCASFCTTSKNSVEAFFSEAKKRNMMVIGGKTLMDRNAPKTLLENSTKGYELTKKLINKWHNNGRCLYAITPRFAITSTIEQMKSVQTLKEEYPECYLQTHLSENFEEIELVKKLYPSFKNYTSIYEHYGFLGKKSLFGHCIHLSESELDLLNESHSKVIFCPTSNLFLGSGLFDLKKINKKNNIQIGVATDIGGGTSFNMLKTLDEAYKICQLQKNKISSLDSFYHITLGNAKCLSLESKIGTLSKGSDADIVVIDSRATSSLEIRKNNLNSLEEELFYIQTLGDDRCISQVYIKGKPAKNT